MRNSLFVVKIAFLAFLLFQTDRSRAQSNEDGDSAGGGVQAGGGAGGSSGGGGDVNVGGGGSGGIGGDNNDAGNGANASNEDDDGGNDDDENYDIGYGVYTSKKQGDGGNGYEGNGDRGNGGGGGGNGDNNGGNGEGNGGSNGGLQIDTSGANGLGKLLLPFKRLLQNLFNIVFTALQIVHIDGFFRQLVKTLFGWQLKGHANIDSIGIKGIFTGLSSGPTQLLKDILNGLVAILKVLGLPIWRLQFIAVGLFNLRITGRVGPNGILGLGLLLRPLKPLFRFLIRVTKPLGLSGVIQTLVKNLLRWNISNSEGSAEGDASFAQTLLRPLKPIVSFILNLSIPLPIPRSSIKKILKQVLGWDLNINGVGEGRGGFGGQGGLGGLIPG